MLPGGSAGGSAPQQPGVVLACVGGRRTGGEGERRRRRRRKDVGGPPSSRFRPVTNTVPTRTVFAKKMKSEGGRGRGGGGREELPGVVLACVRRRTGNFGNFYLPPTFGRVWLTRPLPPVECGLVYSRQRPHTPGSLENVGAHPPPPRRKAAPLLLRPSAAQLTPTANAGTRIVAPHQLLSTA